MDTTLYVVMRLTDDFSAVNGAIWRPTLTFSDYAEAKRYAWKLHLNTGDATNVEEY